MNDVKEKNVETKARTTKRRRISNECETKRKTYKHLKKASKAKPGRSSRCVLEK